MIEVSNYEKARVRYLKIQDIPYIQVYHHKMGIVTIYMAWVV